MAKKKAKQKDMQKSYKKKPTEKKKTKAILYTLHLPPHPPLKVLDGLFGILDSLKLL